MDRYDDDYRDDAYDDGDDPYYDGDDIAVGPPADADAVEHLWNAAHELLGAIRTIVEAADEFVESQRGALSRRMPRDAAQEPSPRVRRIDIDDPAVADDRLDRSSGSPGAPGAPGATPR